MVAAPHIHLGSNLNFKLMLRRAFILTPRQGAAGGLCWALKRLWTWWEREWGRLRPVFLGHQRMWLQERWRCSEPVERGDAGADIPDTSKTPLRSQWQDFPKRKDAWGREGTDASLLYPPPCSCCSDQRKRVFFIIIILKNIYMKCILQQPCALGDILPPRAWVSRVGANPGAAGSWHCAVLPEWEREGSF